MSKFYNSYLINNEIYVSVSTILNTETAGELIYWALNKFGDSDSPKEAYKKFMDEVSTVGTNIHKFIEFDLKKIKLDDKEILDASIPAIEQYLEWKKNHDVKMLESERKCHSKKWRIAGTADLVASIDGKPYVIDIKTGSVMPKAFTQLSAYKAFLQQEPKSIRLKEIDDCGLAVLNIHREGKPAEFITLESFFDGEQTFEDQLGIFHALRYVWAKRNLKSKKWYPVIKNMKELISPLESRFKQQFKL